MVQWCAGVMVEWCTGADKTSENHFSADFSKRSMHIPSMIVGTVALFAIDRQYQPGIRSVSVATTCSRV